jgi:protein gp37
VSDHRAIEWTEATWNPTTGCDRTSPGCDNCYALTLAKRLKAMGNPKYQVDGEKPTSGPGFGLTIHKDQLDLPQRWKAPRVIFVNSMSDLFHPEVPDGFIADVFAVMRDTPRHTYQVLTKRSRRVAQLSDTLDWPANVWLGVSVESARYRFRANHLRETGAQTKFRSVEPLLRPLGEISLEGINWVIVGGESGVGARPMEADWVREVRDQCVSSEVAFFFKQWGGRTPKAGGRELDGRTWDEMPRTVQ